MGEWEGGTNWKSRIERVCITICKIDSQWEFAAWVWNSNPMLSDSLEGVGWGGRWEEGSRGSGHMREPYWERIGLYPLASPREHQWPLQLHCNLHFKTSQASSASSSPSLSSPNPREAKATGSRRMSRRGRNSEESNHVSFLTATIYLTRVHTVDRRDFKLDRRLKFPMQLDWTY